jgi:hypothetical protein
MIIHRHRPRDERRNAQTSLCVLFMSLVASCVLKHDKPQSSDTMTNWLTVCDRQSDCQGRASCVAGLCTLACRVDDTRVCEPLSDNARCTPGAAASYCDQTCRESNDCQSLGESYACLAGVCRTASIVAPANAALDPAGVEGLATMAPPLVPGDALLLSDPLRAANPPIVSWLDDHWSVIWTSSALGFVPASDFEPTVFASDVDRSGKIEQREKPLAAADALAPLRKAGRRFALKTAARDLETCTLGIVDGDTLAVLSRFEFACGGGAFDAVPVPDSEDWLITWSKGVNPNAELFLGRYRPSQQGLLAGPWGLQSAAQQQAGPFIGIGGGDAWVYWTGPGSTSIAHMSGVADAVFLSALGHALEKEEIAPVGSAYALSAVSNGALWLVPDGSALNAVRLPIEQGFGGQGIALQRIVPTTIVDRPPGIARVSANRFAVCYAHSLEPGSSSGNTVAIATIDDAGNLVGGPVSVAQGIENVGGCDLDWSGEELVVAWLDLSDTPMNGPPHATIKARIVSLP